MSQFIKKWKHLIHVPIKMTIAKKGRLSLITWAALMKVHLNAFCGWSVAIFFFQTRSNLSPHNFRYIKNVSFKKICTLNNSFFYLCLWTEMWFFLINVIHIWLFNGYGFELFNDLHLWNWEFNNILEFRCLDFPQRLNLRLKTFCVLRFFSLPKCRGGTNVEWVNWQKYELIRNSFSDCCIKEKMQNFM